MKSVMQPKLKYCPYCGSERIKVVSGVPRCIDCRAVFFITFSRYLRNTPKKEGGTE